MRTKQPSGAVREVGLQFFAYLADKTLERVPLLHPYRPPRWLDDFGLLLL